MPILPKEEKREFLQLSRSLRMKRDFKILRKNSLKNFQKHKFTLDEYINFLTLSNAFANHAPKPFHRMIGKKFKL